MLLPLIKIETIDSLKNLFSWNDNINFHKNITMLGQKFLIYTLKNNGFTFDFTIDKEEKGKPFFKYKNNIHFSISDTKNHIAVAIHDKKIGLDIEYLRKNKQNIAKRNFHINENQYLNNVSSEMYDQAFTQLWTIKEAYVKMTGTGIANNFQTVDLSPKKFDLIQNFQKQDFFIKSYIDQNTQLFVTICTQLK